MFEARICLQLDIRSRLPELAGSLIRIGPLARPGLRVRQGGIFQMVMCIVSPPHWLIMWILS